MYTRHEEVPSLTTWPDKIEAQHFNIVTRALNRISSSIRLELQGLKHLDLILQKDAWIIVDRAFNDLPVAAWVLENPDADRGLHEPAPCELRYYHGHAGMVIRRVLEIMDEVLSNQLNPDDEGHQVLAFPDRKDVSEDSRSDDK